MGLVHHVGHLLGPGEADAELGGGVSRIAVALVQALGHLEFDVIVEIADSAHAGTFVATTLKIT